MSTIIRKEQRSDIREIFDVTVAAFLDAPHTSHTEQFIVNALRDARALAISLVAENGGRIVGHVALSSVAISDGSERWYGLGPISVAPGAQGMGVGSQLMHAALKELESINANGCVLLGDPGYYHRFGFKPISGLRAPPEIVFLLDSFVGAVLESSFTTCKLRFCARPRLALKQKS